MRTISMKVADGIDQRLAAAAKAQRTTKSNVLRAAIRAYLNDDGKRQSGSCLDLAGDLVGSIEGPSDLSSNPRHMKGFGK